MTVSPMARYQPVLYTWEPIESSDPTWWRHCRDWLLQHPPLHFGMRLHERLKRLSAVDITGMS